MPEVSEYEIEVRGANGSWRVVDLTNSDTELLSNVFKPSNLQKMLRGENVCWHRQNRLDPGYTVFMFRVKKCCK